jgi:hypothetical protein
MRRNHLDTHGVIRLTSSDPEFAFLSSPAISSASSSRSAVRNGDRPAETTTNGSSAATSVHSVGKLASSPASSKKYTRSDCQVLARLTNSNDRPNNG